MSVEGSECIIATGALQIDLSYVNNNYQRTLANEVKRCSADRIRKMEPTRRYTALVCFLKQAHQNNMDLLVSSYIKLINGGYTRADNQIDKQFKQNEAMIRESLANYEGMKRKRNKGKKMEHQFQLNPGSQNDMIQNMSAMARGIFF